MITAALFIASGLAVVPATLFLRNLSAYQLLPEADGNEGTRPISVLIPARNEETNLPAALESVLQSAGIDLEVVVLDDRSSDRTAEVVREFSARDRRVRLETALPLPPGWCGKNFACQQLAGHARHPLLVFMDADVRVSRADSLARLAQFQAQSQAALVSGVPCEEAAGLMEKLIIPLIHFVLLGFLPLERMRGGTDPRFAAACGQILAVLRDSYEVTGGHGAVPNRIHDAVALTRHFRASGYRTDLFDATDTFRCRMYRSAAEVWHGFAKNAHEGLGAPALIGPATLLLLGGQVAPLVLLAWIVALPGKTSWAAFTAGALGAVAIFLPRLVAAFRYRQSVVGALLHPLGVCLLVAIQWQAFLRARQGKPTTWKGRTYTATVTASGPEPIKPLAAAPATAGDASRRG